MRFARKCFFLLFFIFSFIILADVPSASASTSINRIAGNDRYQTAVAVSQNGWPDGADSAILAYGQNFPDALSAGPLAHKYDAPILLTGSYNLNEDTAQELKRLKVKKVFIIGGYAVISKGVEAELSALNITSVRIAGQDCYETALLVAKQVGLSKGVFVTTGLDFPDALSIAPIAATNEMPIILVPPNDLTSTQKAFLSKSKIPTSYIVKGYNEISDQVVSQFPNYEFINGADPYERNINLITRFVSSLDLDTVYLATGELFPDALTASALAQKGKNPLILLKGDTIPYSALAFIHSNIISQFNILGGYSVISAATESTLPELPAQIESVEDVRDSVEEKQKYEPPKTVMVTDTNGLSQSVPVTWSLSSVYTLHTGTYRFEGTINNYSGHVYLKLTVYPSVSKITPISAEVILGDSYSLPDTVMAAMSDGSSKDYPVTWSSNIVTLNKTGTYTFKGKVEGLTQTATLTLKVSEDAKIDFPDQNLKEAIADKVGKDDDETIYRSDVINISSLNVRSSGIDDLTGLEYLTNLKTLDLSNNSLTKLPPLTKLTKLKTLKLHNTDLQNLTALKGLTSLTYLDVSDNYIKDFSQLKDFINLTTLYLDDNYPLDTIENYTPDYSPVRLYYDNLDKKDFDL
ncbi:cell wall-binding repeat-containing protein [Desulfosporosinus sp. OT]|uniref:cell wall-binding repeat-containing protein n=1 Tax=Desulfosporosinus sp. OT TaxID=913865 RepID=UPI000223A2CE|nr:cell wall-binding repeat-containing protein [Desulfosporosinus sp. OT]EGW39246.1 leucine Rich Repeat family protein [Desulfosporosinus sp. OT]